MMAEGSQSGAATPSSPPPPKDDQARVTEELLESYKKWVKLSPFFDRKELDLDEEDPKRFLADVAHSYGKKRLFVCCDGTGHNAAGSIEPMSNIARLARSVERVGRDAFDFGTVGGVPQLVYYSSGVGTTSTLTMDSGFSAMTGKGIVNIILNAYCFLSNNYNGSSCRDEIILVGYSRGAFAVRCLAHFINDVGLLRRKGLTFLRLLFRDWVRGDKDLLKKKLKDINFLFHREPKIKVLAEWDTVSALGLPLLSWRDPLSRIPNTVPPIVENAFLALSLNENRWSFKPMVWEHRVPGGRRKVEQCAFLGSHGDVGGGSADAGLSTISLFWMISKIKQACDAEFDTSTLLQFVTPLRPPNPWLPRFISRWGKKVILKNIATSKGNVNSPSRLWMIPHYITFGVLTGKRDDIVKKLAQPEAVNDQAQENGNRRPKTRKCDLKVHFSVHKLSEARSTNNGPLNQYTRSQVADSPDSWEWRMKGDATSNLVLHEQKPNKIENELLRAWKEEAQAWADDNVRDQDALVTESDEDSGEEGAGEGEETEEDQDEDEGEEEEEEETDEEREDGADDGSIHNKISEWKYVLDDNSLWGLRRADMDGFDSAVVGVVLGDTQGAAEARGSSRILQKRVLSKPSWKSSRLRLATKTS